MSIDFSALRNRKGTNFAAVQKTLEKTQGNGFKKDERLWKPVKGSDGKSSNTIRFLPISYVDLVAAEEGKFPAEDLTPMAKILSHAFQGPKGWFIEKSLQTFGEDCPQREMDGPLWKKQKETKDDHLKKVLIPRIAKTDYYAVIYVIKDGTNPENNGQIKIYQFGETIKKFLEKASQPEFEGEVSFDPFDAWEGANLILNLTYEKKVIGTKEIDAPNFTNVKWDTPRPMGEDPFIEDIWKRQYSIMEFYDRKNFKTFDELKAKLCKVMDLDENYNPLVGKPSSSSAAPASTTTSLETKIAETAEAPASKAEPTVAETKAPAPTPTLDTDDGMAEFERLLNG